MRRLLVAALFLVCGMGAFPVAAAATFAAPAFQTQWQQGEAVTPTFWGPLTTAHDGHQEPDKEASGGARLVQYFDKGRMELTNGALTNGLLATEQITGKMQRGDNTFETRAPASVLMAGDQVNTVIRGGVPLPTYAVVGSVKELTQPASAQVGSATTRSLQTFGGGPHMSTSYAPSTFPTGATYPAANIAAYDDVTQHNVPAAFATYRTTAGVATIGYAIIEPFWSPVKVAGVT